MRPRGSVANPPNRFEALRYAPSAEEAAALAERGVVNLGERLDHRLCGLVREALQQAEVHVTRAGIVRCDFGEDLADGLGQ